VYRLETLLRDPIDKDDAREIAFGQPKSSDPRLFGGGNAKVLPILLLHLLVPACVQLAVPEASIVEVGAQFGVDEV
jgi:hypothetical protein